MLGLLLAELAPWMKAGTALGALEDPGRDDAAGSGALRGREAEGREGGTTGVTCGVVLAVSTAGRAEILGTLADGARDAAGREAGKGTNLRCGRGTDGGAGGGCTPSID